MKLGQRLCLRHSNRWWKSRVTSNTWPSFDETFCNHVAFGNYCFIVGLPSKSPLAKCALGCPNRFLKSGKTRSAKTSYMLTRLVKPVCQVLLSLWGGTEECSKHLSTGCAESVRGWGQKEAKLFNYFDAAAWGVCRVIGALAPGICRVATHTTQHSGSSRYHNT